MIKSFSASQDGEYDSVEVLYLISCSTESVVMATENDKTIVNVIDGPDAMEIVSSLMRPERFAYADIYFAYSVLFFFDEKHKVFNGGFRAYINGIKREAQSRNKWILEGFLFNDEDYIGFNGQYDSNTHKGVFSIVSGWLSSILNPSAIIYFDEYDFWNSTNWN